MSTVLWANSLVDEAVTSDESDKPALHRHANKLDRIARRMGAQSFAALCDTTDLEFNLGDDELPPGMTSTRQLMARSGKWMEAAAAAGLLAALIAEIDAKAIRFGLFRNEHDAVLAELRESLVWAQAAAASGGKFNFSVVM